jgi:hypothetical protein
LIVYLSPLQREIVDSRDEGILGDYIQTVSIRQEKKRALEIWDPRQLQQPETGALDKACLRDLETWYTRVDVFGTAVMMVPRGIQAKSLMAILNLDML